MFDDTTKNYKPDEGEEIATKQEYSAGAIRVMEGLEAVRKRPAMYIGSTGVQGLHHLVYEVVDNSVDESLAGHCDTIMVTLHADGSCSVEDNGRGIPTGIHPTEGISATEVVLTKLHAGGKFDKDSYKFSGGLHGVGISVVNALSVDLWVTVFQNGHIYTQQYSRGKPHAPLAMVGDTTKRGTLVRFLPDPEIFTETVELNFDILAARLRELAFLNKKLRITIADERTDKQSEFYFEGGIISFVQHINKRKNVLFPDVLYGSFEDEKYIFEVAMQYNDGYGEQLFAFVNNINTVDGGTHVSGFRSALTKACNKKAHELNMFKAGESFSSEDVREGLVAVISIKVPEPQFEGQTKTKLGNNEIKGIFDSWFFGYLETFFEENPSTARKILQKAEVAMHAREAAKRARDLTRRKTVLESTILPGKLADCTDENPVNTELFIVEGDSAGGPAKQGRDRNIQAILPLKGKILNVERARLDKILGNEEIRALVAAIGAGVGTNFDIARVRYHKIILMTDADVDGSHIRTLLLTLFFRYMCPIIEKGYLYIAQPPLYKAKIGKKEQYLKDDTAFKLFLFDWAAEQAALSINEQGLSRADWDVLLRTVYAYSEQLMQVGRLFNLSADQVHALVLALHRNPWSTDDDVSTLIERVQEAFPGYTIGFKEQEKSESSDDLVGRSAHEGAIICTKLNNIWTVSIPLGFFFASEPKQLLLALKPLMTLENHEWSLTIPDRSAKQAGIGILALIDAIGTISKPFMYVQRYKGLGEMNADQLAETAMDQKTRTMLQVSIKDAVAADFWFTTLMGDDVSGRKEYIERYGHFVKNLDI